MATQLKNTGARIGPRRFGRVLEPPNDKRVIDAEMDATIGGANDQDMHVVGILGLARPKYKV
jgi:hypothetical protein